MLLSFEIALPQEQWHSTNRQSSNYRSLPGYGLTNKDATMATIEESLTQLMRLEGATGCCIIDFRSKTMLGKAERRELDIDLGIAAAGNIEVVTATTRSFELLGMNERLEDILLTLTSQFHIIKPLKRHKEIFIFIVLDTDRSNLPLARRKLAAIESELVLESIAA
jgi:hypothetical protein